MLNVFTITREMLENGEVDLDYTYLIHHRHPLNGWQFCYLEDSAEIAQIRTKDAEEYGMITESESELISLFRKMLSSHAESKNKDSFAVVAEEIFNRYSEHGILIHTRACKEAEAIVDTMKEWRVYAF